MKTRSHMRVARLGVASAALALLAGCGAARPAENKTDAPAAVATAEPGGPVVASFDCAKARAPLEQLICSDAGLAQADRDLAAAYQAALKQAAGSWRGPLKDTQRAWLAYAGPACLAGEPAERASECQAYFEDRTRELEHTFSTSGGRAFITLTRYEATGRASLEQIVSPSAEEQRWNDALSQRLRNAMKVEAADMQAEASVWSVAPGFIDARIQLTFPRGPGGDSYQTMSVPWSLALGRELTLADVFTDPEAAKDAVARLALKQLDAQARKDGAGPEADLETLRQLVDEPRYWHYRQEGVELDFDDDNAFGGAHYALTLGVTVPWSELAPYLRKDLPFDPKALRDTF